MPYNRYKCNEEVKSYFKQHNHQKCSSSKNHREVTGLFLNQFIYHRPFSNTKKYQICHNLWTAIDLGKIIPLTQEERDNNNDISILNLKRDGAIPAVSPAETVDSTPDNQPATDRQARYARRALLHQQQEANDPTYENEEDHWRVTDRTPTKDAATTTSKKRINKFDAFASKVESYAQTYRKPYKDLKFRSRLSRIDECVAQIVACCIDKNRLEKDGIRYIEKDEDLANECLNIVNSIRERLALKMKMDLPTEVDPIPLVHGDEEEKEKGLDLETVIKILSESTGNGYERVRKELKKKLPAKHTDNLKSLYLLKKDLPLKVESVTYSCVDGRNFDSRKEEVDDLIYGFGNFVKTEEEALQLLSSGSEEVVHGAKLEGGMVDWIDGMVKKLEKKGNEIGDDDDVIVLSCFDGAEAIRSEKQVKGVISFSSLLLTPKLVNEGVLLAGSSFNILTWMQILGKEELAVMKPCLMEYFNNRRELFEKRSKPSLLPNQNVCLYDMHDGKLLYLLSQHSMWNRKNHPFLLCKCKRIILS